MTNDGDLEQALPAADGRRYQVVFASHTAETSVFRVGSHHLSRELARAGHHVVHLATPLSPVKLLGLGNRMGLGSRWRSLLAGADVDDDGRASVIPFTALPVQLTAGWKRNLALRTAIPGLRRSIRSAGLAAPDILLMDQPLFAGLGQLIGARRTVYRPTDVYTEPRLVAAQQRAIAVADAVVATSQTVWESLPATARRLPHLVLGNGVDSRFFGSGDIPGARSDAVVYVGALDDRVDWTWLCALARRRPLIAFDLYGPLPTTDVPDLPPNVCLRGVVDYGEVPQLLARYRVALMPFGPTLANRGRSPMKLYEYLAAGLTVLATPNFAASASPPPGVWVVGSDDAADILTSLLGQERRNVAGAAIAGDHDWSQRAALLVEFLRAV